MPQEASSISEEIGFCLMRGLSSYALPGSIAFRQNAPPGRGETHAARHSGPEAVIAQNLRFASDAARIDLKENVSHRENNANNNAKITRAVPSTTGSGGHIKPTEWGWSRLPVNS